MAERLKLLKPLKELYISQNFGEDSACVLTGGKKVIGRASGKECPIGYTSLYKSSGLLAHNGLDFKAYKFPIYSSIDGIVEEIQTEEARGLGIGIVSNQKFNFHNGDYFAKTRYWHLASFDVIKGQQISKGQLIGMTDNTGYSSAEHLHFELKPVDYQNGNIYNVFQDNGYFGAIDPLLYLSQMYAYEINTWLDKIRYQLIDTMNRLQKLLSR